ncbi:MAG: hypothetical protein KAV87_54090, partial [Desulfobacteraceae bacterium]|nr:hypothetical protein [Desulfobacteraceae bacterium]
NAIQSLCTKGIVLNNGRIESIGNIGEAIHHYQNLVSEADLKGAKQMRGIKILSVRFSSASNANRVTPNSSLCAEVDFYTEYNLSNCYWNFVIEDSEGRYIVHSRTDQQNEKPIFIPGIHRVDVNIPRLCIRAGVYTLWFRLFVSTGDLVETVDSDPIMLEVSGPQVSGYLDIPCKWSWRHVSMRGHQTQSNLEI